MNGYSLTGAHSACQAKRIKALSGESPVLAQRSAEFPGMEQASYQKSRTRTSKKIIYRNKGIRSC